MMRDDTSRRLETPKGATCANGMAMLYGNPVTRHCRVDEADKMAHRGMQKPRKARLQYIKKATNAMEMQTTMYLMHMEGRSREQVVCASGKASDSSNDENVSNAAVEHADGSIKRLGLVCVEIEWEVARQASMDEASWQGCNVKHFADAPRSLPTISGVSNRRHTIEP